MPGRSDFVRCSGKTGSRVSVPSGPFQGRPTLDRQDPRVLLAKWLSPVDLTRYRSSATAANTGGNTMTIQPDFATVQTNGIRLRVALAGKGPLVVLVHGWPESWYSWRHQIPALAEAGFHVVAPDQRGYGQTDKPEPIEAYHILNLVSDIVGLVNSLGEERAVIVGHDWGAPVAWTSALI